MGSRPVQSAGRVGFQIAMQASQAVSELPQQLGPQQLMSAASQPMQQLTSVFTQGLGSNLAGQGISQDQLLAHFRSVDQLGMYGTSPLGSAGGAYGGAGLLTSATSSTRCGPRRMERAAAPRSRKWRRLSQRPQLPVLVGGRWAPDRDDGALECGACPLRWARRGGGIPAVEKSRPGNSWIRGIR
ncbi:PPE domain protein [Mycobacterium xenopi 4042]|uniref:PPE domain protein n=1 Tax=Mycobacterium xenopi 4042 TaxID=1299334 RepID=X7ZZA1_MYCXE|nr:PPE domain protein [Mycobacterium xenopi 4042]